MPIAGHDTYITTAGRSAFGSRLFYPRIAWTVWKASRKAAKGRYGNDEWVESSLEILTALEKAGVSVMIEGMDNIKSCDGPAVFVANHMSTLETFVLPCIIEPLKDVTFVVKEGLIRMPVFGHVMRSRDPIVVGRTNPREDLKAVLEEGTKRIKSGRSVIIFPQSTRSVEFRPAEFNSLGVKLAAKAGAPLIPVALMTDAWGIGRMMKEFGPLDPSKPVHFAFGHPMKIEGRGAAEHEKTVSFISEQIAAWKK